MAKKTKKERADDEDAAAPEAPPLEEQDRKRLAFLISVHGERKGHERFEAGETT